jgi:required for meiotic nuclear division protein 1
MIEKPETLTVTAFQLGESLSLKALRTRLGPRLLAAGSQELFFGPSQSGVVENTQPPDHGYLYLLNYGVVIYAGHDSAYIEETNRLLQEFVENPLATPLREDFAIQTGAATLDVGHTEVHIGEVNADTLRVIMLYVGQSVALDYYEGLADKLLKAPRPFIESMRVHGKLKASRRAVMRYIGETLDMRNRIIDNLYVLDTPDVAWENEELDRLDRGMKRTFDIVTRFRALEDQLDVVQNNLELFAELIQHRDSNLLEIIIIALFLVEIFKLIVEAIWV